MKEEKNNWLPHSPLPNDPDRPEYNRRPTQASQLPELTLQSRCFLWAWNSYPEYRRMMFHVQNKARNAIEGAKFKALGVVAGPSDMVILAPGGRVIWAEFKTATGKQSPEQKDFQTKAQAWGHFYTIIRTETEFHNLVATVWGPPQNNLK